MAMASAQVYMIRLNSECNVMSALPYSQWVHDANVHGLCFLKVPKHPACRLVLSCHQRYHEYEQRDPHNVEDAADLRAQSQHAQPAAVDEGEEDQTAGVDTKLLRTGKMDINIKDSYSVIVL